jgi:hypothetical protein
MACERFNSEQPSQQLLHGYYFGDSVLSENMDQMAIVISIIFNNFGYMEFLIDENKSLKQNWQKKCSKQASFQEKKKVDEGTFPWPF